MPFSAVSQDDTETDDLEKLIVAEEPSDEFSASKTGIELISNLSGVIRTVNDNHKLTNDLNKAELTGESHASRCDLDPTFPLEDSWPARSLRIFENWIPFLRLGALAALSC